MRNIIKSQAVLHQYFASYGEHCGASDADAEYGRARLAEMVLASHSLSDEDRRDSYNSFVAAYAKSARLPTKTSLRAVGDKLNFVGLIIDQRTKAGDRARKTIQRKLYVLHPRTPEKAQELAAKLMAPRVVTKATSKDKATALAARYLKLTVAQRRWFMEAITA